MVRRYFLVAVIAVPVLLVGYWLMHGGLPPLLALAWAIVVIALALGAVWTAL